MAVPQVDKKMLGELEVMGFPAVRSIRALHYSGNSNLESAINWLLEHESDPDIDQLPLVPREISIECGDTSNEVRNSVQGMRNLLAIQKPHMKQSTVLVKKASVPDLREKLSRVQRPQPSSTVQIPKPAPQIAKGAKPVQKRQIPTAAVAARPVTPVTEQVNAATAPKQSQQKTDASLDRLLKSLDLEKYSINFQAEEVDMKALVHMNEEDMKSLGIPMGPRKKILSALASKRKKSSKSLPPTS